MTRHYPDFPDRPDWLLLLAVLSLGILLATLTVLSLWALGWWWFGEGQWF